MHDITAPEVHRFPPWHFPAPVGVWSVIAALLLGAAWPLGFAPFSWSPLPILALAGIFALSARQSPKAAFWHGYLFGWAGFASGLYWLVHTLSAFSETPLVLAIAGVLLLAGYLALFPALVLGIARRWFSGTALLLTMPLLWVMAEWLRGHLFTGFPWLSLGYSQTLAPLGGLAPWMGVYGVGFAAAWLAGLLAWCWAKESQRVFWLMGFPSTLLLVFGAEALGRVNFTQPVAAPVQVRLLQGNIPQSIKWSPTMAVETMQRYHRLLNATPAQTRLVIMPESAIPLFQDEAQGYLTLLQQWAEQHQAGLILGIDERLLRGDVYHYYNSALLLDAKQTQHYRKRHLVPFGEYVPLRPWLGLIIEQLVPGQGDFQRGRAVGTHSSNGQIAGISICYEAVVAELIRADVLAGARFLVNISNDDWFGDSTAPHQHLQMAQMRARESQREMLRATNTGVTAIIGSDGHIRAHLPQSKIGALDGQVQPRTGLTPYLRYGDGPLFGGLGLLLLLAWWRNRQINAASSS